jgi:hypothetical protein
LKISLSSNCTFLKISCPGNLKKGAIPGARNWHFLKNSLSFFISNTVLFTDMSLYIPN